MIDGVSVDDLFSAEPGKAFGDGPVRPYDYLLIDGGGLVTTAWAANRKFDVPEDRIRAGVYIFVMCLTSLARFVGRDAKVIIAWDGEDNRKWRRGLHPWYKFGRGSAIDRLEVRAVMEKLHMLVEAMGVSEVVIPGREADDLVATLASRYSADGKQCLIFSDDKDYMQIISESVHLARRSKKGVVFSPSVCQAFNVKYGPEYLMMKAIMGDPGDNIRGLTGIGEKKAEKIITAMPGMMGGSSDGFEDLDTSLQKAVIRAGRLLLWPGAPDDFEFMKSFKQEHGMGTTGERTSQSDTNCVDAAVYEAVRCFNLVQLDSDVVMSEPVFPDANPEAVPRILATLGLGNEEDIFSSVYSMLGMAPKGGVRTYTAVTRFDGELAEGEL